MDAIALLKADHKKVGELFGNVEDLPENDHTGRLELFTQIANELTVHSSIEETIFYPALKSKALSAQEDDATQEVLEAYEEHGNVKAMLEKLKATGSADESYNAKLQVLSELVKHHVHEEEHEMFKQAQQLFDRGELDALGDKLARAKQEALKASV